MVSWKVLVGDCRNMRKWTWGLSVRKVETGCSVGYFLPWSCSWRNFTLGKSTGSKGHLCFQYSKVTCLLEKLGEALGLGEDGKRLKLWRVPAKPNEL